MRSWWIALGLAGSALALLMPSGLQAQHFKPIAAWDGPDFMAPGPENDIGVYYIHPRDTDGGVAATWRSGTGLILGVRGDYIHSVFGSSWGIGGEAKGGIGPVAPPLAIDWTAGIGALITSASDQSGGGESDLRVPVGLSIGLRLVSGGLILTPYVHPRVSLAYVSFNNGGGSDTSVEFDTDVGVDLQLTPGLLLRLGGTFGDQPAFGAGLALALGRL